MRAGAVIGQIEAGGDAGPASADLGFGPAEVGFGYDTGGQAADSEGFSAAFGPGTVGRREAVIWGLSGLWLFLVWRAVKGF